eukprot:CAMPEP_0119088792 /NCGR_PEP_ID=MMETSP1178-20130426/146732_1 /TAXON_ID=33656 /ORGANISM="unid sp, Strain CCMP2000" /LENGTH=42 /DNA_ID= /DNA_START= /DNA_END= /DNA_ORIENTATION=
MPGFMPSPGRCMAVICTGGIPGSPGRIITCPGILPGMPGRGA